MRDTMKRIERLEAAMFPKAEPSARPAMVAQLIAERVTDLLGDKAPQLAPADRAWLNSIRAAVRTSHA